jgi:F-type H+-transporting ATPase subunit delta
VHVTAAKALDEDDRRQLEAVLEGRFGMVPVLEVEVVPEILGGLIIEAGDQRLDLSIQQQLEELKTSLYRQAGELVAVKAG